MNELDNDIKHLNKACDALAQACYDVSQTTDWRAHAALLTMEQILDDLADRITELRGIKEAVLKVKEGSDGDIR